MITSIFVMRGGMTNITIPWLNEGWLVSFGMDMLAARLRKLGPAVDVTVCNWANFQGVEEAIRLLPEERSVVLIGYSGGGAWATWVTRNIFPRRISLVVGYDPSPKNSVLPFGGNVQRALCYHNLWPLFFGLGGGLYVGHMVEVEDISMQHAAVQFSERLHQKTIAAVQAVIGDTLCVD